MHYGIRGSITFRTWCLLKAKAKSDNFNIKISLLLISYVEVVIVYQSKLANLYLKSIYLLGKYVQKILIKSALIAVNIMNNRNF